MFIIRLLQLNFILCTVYAIAYLIFPVSSLSFYEVTGNVGLVTFAQYFGSWNLCFSILLFMALKSKNIEVLRMIVISFFLTDLIGTLILLYGQIQGNFNSMGWTSVFISTLFATGYGYGFFKKLPKQDLYNPTTE